MKTIEHTTLQLIKDELEHIPEEYQKNFNSVHEALGVIREEYIELENEIFFGKKQAMRDVDINQPGDNYDAGILLWKANIRNEAVQVAAMCVRLIQELT